MKRITTNFLVAIAVLLWTNGLIAQLQFPGGGPGGDPQQRMGMMLDAARQASPQMWPRQKPQMLDRMSGRIKDRFPNDPASAAKAVQAIGDILDQARTLSAADFVSQKPQLVIKMLRVMSGSGATSSPDGSAAKPVIKTDKLYNGAMFDAHFHMILPTDLPPDQMVPYLKDAGISGVYFFAPSETRLTNLTFRLQRQYPNFIFLSVMLPHDAQRQILFNDEGLKSMEQLLATGMIRVIGEIPLRHPVIKRQRGEDFPADGPIALKLIDMAANHQLPINLHVEHESSAELERALVHNPKATVIWAHCGDAPPALVRSLLTKYGNLYADISCRNPYFHRQHPIDYQSLTTTDGTLKQDWNALFEAFPDRFMFGSDVGGASDSLSSTGTEPPRHKQLKEVVQYYRSVLGQLTPATAEDIGHLNAERLIGVK